eukprot:2483355-Karenia_brevis.AAC.1
MNGCEVVLEDIQFADEEPMPHSLLAGCAHELEYLPTALLLRVDGAAWVLPPDELPALSVGLDKR